jgi:nitroimidazol reductase NimA-like FMN-containing flavoprotein (pyridoxamine 5'-phosphate oxidase superfamily)
MVDDRTRDAAGLEILDREECLRLLTCAGLGRIGLSVGALPVILPVRFRLDGERILIRTHSGTTLDAATRDAVVAFEADATESGDAPGWSVLVTGVASHVPTGPGEAATDVSRLPPWSVDRPDRIIAISTDRMCGRRGFFPGEDQA